MTAGKVVLLAVYATLKLCSNVFSFVTMQRYWLQQNGGSHSLLIRVL